MSGSGVITLDPDSSNVGRGFQTLSAKPNSIILSVSYDFFYFLFIPSYLTIKVMKRTVVQTFEVTKQSKIPNDQSYYTIEVTTHYPVERQAKRSFSVCIHL